MEPAKDIPKGDRPSSLFFLGVALAICIESLRLGIGSFSNPGPGLVPLGSGLVLGLVGLVVLSRTVGLSLPEKARPQDRARWKKLWPVLVSLAGYAFLINSVGFLTVTFLWMLLVCRGIGRLGWKTSFLTALLTTLSCYLLFEHYLGVRFPRGIWVS